MFPVTNVARPQQSVRLPSEETGTPTATVDERNVDAYQRPTQVAAAAAPSAAETEVANKINTLVQNRFGGNWQRAFEYYAGGPGKQVNHDGVMRMLGDADVGGLFMPRGIVANRLMERFDADRNGQISWPEFSTSMRNLGIRV